MTALFTAPMEVSRVVFTIDKCRFLRTRVHAFTIGRFIVSSSINVGFLFIYILLLRHVE